MTGSNASRPTKQIESAGHAHETTSFVLPLDGDVDWPAFTVWLSALLHCHGDRILRVKGKLYAASTGKPLIIHGVQHLMYPPVHLEAAHDDDQIGRAAWRESECQYMYISGVPTTLNK